MKPLASWRQGIPLLVPLLLVAHDPVNAPPANDASALRDRPPSLAELDARFATLGIRVAEDRVEARLEVFLGAAATGDRAGKGLATRPPAKFAWDGLPIELKRLGQAAAPRRLYFEFTHNEMPELKVGPHQLTVSGLVCPPGTELSVTVLAGERMTLAGISPGAVSATSSRVSAGWGERMVHRYHGCPAVLVVDLEHGKARAVSEKVLDRAIQYGVPVMTALLILLLSTLIQRWLSLRGNQQGVRQALEARLQRIEVDNRPELRQEFLTYISQLREKPEYGGFSSRFTAPLDAISRLGNINDVSQYRSQLTAMKMGVRLSWILFTRGDGR